MKKIYPSLLILIMLNICMKGSAQTQETKGTICKQFVLPKIIITNKRNTPLQHLTISYKIDGKEKGSFLWKGNLSVFQSEVVTLPILPLVAGMNTFSIYTKELSAVEVELDWADYEDQEQQIIISKAPVKDTFKQEEHTDDCNCLKAADEKFSQINLWIYQTGSDQNDIRLMGSTDKGVEWVSGEQTVAKTLCSDVVLPFENKRGTEVGILITQKIEEVITTEVEHLETEQSITPNFDGFTTYPNPFTHHTTVRYRLEQTEEVELVLYNILGKQVTTIMPKKVQQKGIHKYQLKHKGLSKGMYLLSLHSSKGKKTIKIIHQ